MADANATVAVVGIAGTLVGALAGPALAARLNARREREAKLRDLHVELYGQALLYAHRTDRHMDVLVWPELDHPANDAPSTAWPVSQISAGMILFGHRPVREAWLELLAMEVSIDEDVANNYPELKYDPEFKNEGIPDDAASITAIRRAVTTLSLAAREAVGVGD